jgi:two-component system, LytTR family, response regulator
MNQSKRKIKVLIVDDEPLARRGIRQLLDAEIDFEIAGEASNGREAVAAIKNFKPDLVFLDVQMPLLDGFAFLEKIGAENLPEIVFVTAYDEHAIRAFEAGAIDYVLKPINPERFQKTLERVRRRVLAGENESLEDKLANLLSGLKLAPEENLPERIAVRENERIRFLSVEKIERISSNGNYVEIYSGGEKFTLRETMDGIERKLNPKDFVRIRRSAIVRVSQIEELRQLFNGEFEIVLHGGAKIASSRRYRKNLDALLKS